MVWRPNEARAAAVAASPAYDAPVEYGPTNPMNATPAKAQRWVRSA